MNNAMFPMMVVFELQERQLKREGSGGAAQQLTYGHRQCRSYLGNIVFYI